MLIEESEKELINTPKNDGMHKGEDTALYLCKGFRVIGIEADPELVEICRKRFINEINSGQLKII